MAIPKTKTYDHLGGQVNVETDSGSVKDPESGIPVKQDIDKLKNKAKDLEDILNDLGLKIDEKLVEVDEDGFFIIDSSNNVGLRYSKEGLDVAKLTEHFGKIIKGLGIIGNNNSHEVEVAEDGFFLVDSNNNVGFRITDKKIDFIGGEIGSGDANISNGYYPAPKTIIEVYFETTEPIPTVKNEDNPILAHGKVKVIIDGFVLQKYATIEVQGKSSANLPKKNFTFAFFDDKSCSKEYEFRIGNMVSHSEYVYKANYIDSTHVRNIASNRIWEKFIQSYDFPNRGNEGVLTYDTGALCHVDGYPCVVYLNDAFYGLGDFNIGKKRGNYDMSKNNQNHMLMQAEPRTSLVSYNPIQWEIRNPKMPDAEYANRVAIWFADNAKSGDEFKADFPNHHNVENFIDYWVFAEFTYAEDILDNNIMMATWDADMFYIYPYDLDTTFGLGWDGKAMTSAKIGSVADATLSHALSALSTRSFWVKFRNAYFNEICDRYETLKEKGVISIKTVNEIITGLQRYYGETLFKAEYKKWTEIPSMNNTSKMQILKWVKDRISWMDSYYKKN